jgi:hypothetical protein
MYGLRYALIVVINGLSGVGSGRNDALNVGVVLGMVVKNTIRYRLMGILRYGSVVDVAMSGEYWDCRSQRNAVVMCLQMGVPHDIGI